MMFDVFCSDFLIFFHQLSSLLGRHVMPLSDILVMSGSLEKFSLGFRIRHFNLLREKDTTESHYDPVVLKHRPGDWPTLDNFTRTAFEFLFHFELFSKFPLFVRR